MKTRSKSYWERRSSERLSNAEKSSLPYLKRIQKEYRASSRAIVEQVRDLYAAYYRKSGDFDVAELKKVTPQGDVKRFLTEMRTRGLSTYLPENYRGRMSRLELLNNQIVGKVKEIAAKEEALTTDLYGKVFRDTYYRTGYDTSKAIGETLSFGTLDKQTVERALDTKFYGKNYSKRIWGNTGKLATELQGIIAQAITTGQAPEKTIRQVRDRFNVSQFNAVRLVRTEVCYFENQAELESYSEMGIEEYVFLSTLDGRTSKICRAMDGKHFKVKDAKAGENVPPLHPYCRSTIRPYIGVDFEPKTRIMRDPETGKNKSIDNVSYEEWKEKFVVPTRSKVQNKGKMKAVGAILDQNATRVRANCIKDVLNEGQLSRYNELLAAHEQEKALYETYADRIHIEDTDYTGLAHYNPASNSIKLNLMMDTKVKLGDDAYRTLFHESGHNIDAISNGLYNSKPFSASYQNGVFPRTIKEEARAYAKKLLSEGQKINPDLRLESAYMAITQEVRRNSPKDYSYISDIFSGATRNKVKIGAYHPTSYWSRGGDDILATEAFAEMYSASILNKNAISLIKKYFPKSYEIYRDMIEEMTKRGKNGAI